MKPLRPAAKIGIVIGSLLVAFAVADVAVVIRQKLTDGPEAQASSGMYAFGDLVLGVGIFGLLAVVPLGLGLYWLRPHARFWRGLIRVMLLLAATGPLAVIVSGWFREPVGNWAMLTDARFACMPLVALALSTCGLFAPQPRQRWILIIAGLAEGGLFAGVVLFKFVLSR